MTAWPRGTLLLDIRPAFAPCLYTSYTLNFQSRLFAPCRFTESAIVSSKGRENEPELRLRTNGRCRRWPISCSFIWGSWGFRGGNRMCICFRSYFSFVGALSCYQAQLQKYWVNHHRKSRISYSSDTPTLYY